MPQRPSEFTTRERVRQWALHAAALVGLVILAYVPAFTGGWLWDDDGLITDNSLVVNANGLWRIWFWNTTPDYWPLTQTSFWLEYRLWGDWPPGYHVVNVLLHAANAVLVWRMLERLGVPCAWLAAAVWGVHPVAVGSVAWVAERKNTLSMLFGCVTVLRWMDFEDRGERRWYLESLGAFALALLAKTSLVTLPLMLPVLTWWRQGKVTRGDLVRTIPFLLVSLVLGLVTVWYQLGEDRGPPVSITSRIPELLGRGGVLAGRAVGFYLWKDFWPTGLVMVYPHWHLDPSRPMEYLPTLLLVAVFFGLWWKRDREWARASLVALAIFVLALFPILGFLPAIYMKNHSYVADHWQYVALVAPVALAVSAAARWLQGEWVRKGAAVVVLAVLAALTFQHAIIHRSQKALWTHNLTVTDSWDAHLGLCRQLMLEGKIPEAIAEAKLAIGRFGGATLAWVHLADLLVKEDRFAEAVVAYRVAIDQDAGDEFYSRAGIAAAKSGDLAAAVEFFAEGAKRLPDDVSLRIDWGRALHELGRRDESIDRYREALAIDGEMPAALNGLAYCLASRPRAARQPIEPEDAAEAVELAKRACTLTDDKDAAYLDTLATAYAAGGDFEAAVATAERALALAEETDDKELLNEVRGHLDRFRVRLPIAEP